MFRIILSSIYIVTGVFGALTFYDFFYDVREYNLAKSVKNQEFADITIPYSRIIKFLVSTKSSYLISQNTSDESYFENYSIDYRGDIKCNYSTADIQTMHAIKSSLPIFKKIAKDAIIWQYSTLSLPFQLPQINVLETYLNHIGKKYVFQDIPCKLTNSKIKIAKFSQ